MAAAQLLYWLDSLCIQMNVELQSVGASDLKNGDCGVQNLFYKSLLPLERETDRSNIC